MSVHNIFSGLYFHYLNITFAHILWNAYNIYLFKALRLVLVVLELNAIGC